MTPGATLNRLGKTDAQLAELDVLELLRDGLGGDASARGELFGDGAVAAAIALERVDVLARSVAFLASVVRSGGPRYAASLPEPLPTAAQTAVIRPWLEAAADGPDEQVARWLEAVSAVLALRASTDQAR